MAESYIIINHQLFIFRFYHTIKNSQIYDKFAIKNLIIISKYIKDYNNYIIIIIINFFHISKELIITKIYNILKFILFKKINICLRYKKLKTNIVKIYNN